jgi:hypothetical protein
MSRSLDERLLAQPLLQDTHSVLPNIPVDTDSCPTGEETEQHHRGQSGTKSRDD